MNTSENIQNETDDIIINLKAQLWELQEQVKDQEMEIAAYQRRLFIQWEDLIDTAHVLQKIRDEIGADRLNEIYDNYVKNEKADAIQHQRELARTCEYGLDLDALIGSEN